MTERQTIIPPGREVQYTRFHFAPAVRVGDVVHVSGVIGLGPDGTPASEPLVQFRQAFVNLAGVLEACGCTFADVVDITSFHVGLQAHLGDFMAAKDEVVGEPYPAWTAIGCTELAVPGALVEIKAVAQAPG